MTIKFCRSIVSTAGSVEWLIVGYDVAANMACSTYLKASVRWAKFQTSTVVGSFGELLDHPACPHSASCGILTVNSRRVKPVARKD